MKKNRYLLLWINLTPALMLLATSCEVCGPIADPYLVAESRQKENIYYVPSMLNTPLLSEKGDLDFNLVRSSGSYFRGVEMQAAYLPTKHFGIIGGYSYLSNDINKKCNHMNYMNYNKIEIGSGYINEFSSILHFETYVGLGNGEISNSHQTGYSNLNLTNFFLQPALAIGNKKKTVQFGLASRFIGINFNVRDTSFKTDRERFSNNQLKSLYNQPFHFIWEPALVFRFGWKNFLFHTGYSYSADLTQPDLYRSKSNLSLGFSLRFNSSKN